MKPWIELARASAEGGGILSLHQRDREYVIRVDGQELMSSRRHASEDELAVAACAGLGPGARVLIGGLGMGFSARAALDVLPADAELVVAELSPAVVAWNEGVLGALAGHPLRDPRVRVQVGDVGALIRAGVRAYDAIALDVDNSPHALTRPGNRALYGEAGLRAARAALRPGGRLAVWSDARYPEFERRLRAAGFHTETRAVRSGGQAHIIYMGYDQAMRSGR